MKKLDFSKLQQEHLDDPEPSLQDEPMDWPRMQGKSPLIKKLDFSKLDCDHESEPPHEAPTSLQPLHSSQLEVEKNLLSRTPRNTRSTASRIGSRSWKSPSRRCLSARIVRPPSPLKRRRSHSPSDWPHTPAAHEWQPPPVYQCTSVPVYQRGEPKGPRHTQCEVMSSESAADRSPVLPSPSTARWPHNLCTPLRPHRLAPTTAQTSKQISVLAGSGLTNGGAMLSCVVCRGMLRCARGGSCWRSFGTALAQHVGCAMWRV